MSSSFAKSALSKQTVTYLDIVAATVLGYDYLVTFTREVTLIWPAPWSVGKVLFFLTRYPVFAETTLVLYHQFAIMSPRQCDVVFKTIGYQLGTGTLIAESILAVRTWVIWRRNPYVAAGLASCLVLFWTPVFYILAQALNSLVFAVAPNPDTPGCFLQSQKDILFVVFILISTFETIILVLTLVKCFDQFRRSNSSLGTLYRDGVLNYVYLFIMSLLNVIILLTAPHSYTTLLSALQRVFHAVLSGRVLLHLREVSENRGVRADKAFGTYPRGSNIALALQTATWFGDDDDEANQLQSRMTDLGPRIHENDESLS